MYPGMGMGMGMPNPMGMGMGMPNPMGMGPMNMPTMAMGPMGMPMPLIPGQCSLHMHDSSAILMVATLFCTFALL